MRRVFFDYPNPTVNRHGDPKCDYFHRPEMLGHRLIRITNSTISREFENFADGKYVFKAERELNSLWLEVDFQDKVFELAIVKHIQRLLVGRYMPFGKVSMTQHCG
jgi:hypothetical protein